MMKKILLLTLFLPVLAVAKMVDVERETTGHGNSYMEAVNSALLEAVQQVRGLEIGTEKNLHFSVQQTVSDRTDVVVGEMGVKQDVYSQSKGWVKSYEIISSTPPANAQSQWTVTARVVVPRFESNAVPDDKRHSIVVMPFRVAKPSFEYNNTVITPAEASIRLQEAIQEKLTQSRRFAVVNRDFGEEFRSEVALLKSDNVSAVEASRLGQVAGADFMVVGRIYHIGESPKAKKSFYGAKMNAGMIRLEAAFQVIEVPTQKVAWSDVIRLDVKPDADFEITDVYQSGGKTIASNLLSVIYPLRILDIVSAEQIYLTQGGELINRGGRYAVHSAGRTIKDPDTGMNVSVEGATIAEVEITDVQAKYSVAKLISGDMEQFDAGSVLRPLSAEDKPRPPRRETPGSSDAPIQW